MPFSELSVVFMDTTSIYFEGEGDQSLGRRPAPMSGGQAVTGRRWGEGDHPICTTEGRKIGETPRRSPSGLP